VKQSLWRRIVIHSLLNWFCPWKQNHWLVDWSRDIYRDKQMRRCILVNSCQKVPIALWGLRGLGPSQKTVFICTSDRNFLNDLTASWWVVDKKMYVIIPPYHEGLIKPGLHCCSIPQCFFYRPLKANLNKFSLYGMYFFTYFCFVFSQGRIPVLPFYVQPVAVVLHCLNKITVELHHRWFSSWLKSSFSELLSHSSFRHKKRRETASSRDKNYEKVPAVLKQLM